MLSKQLAILDTKRMLPWLLLKLEDILVTIKTNVIIMTINRSITWASMLIQIIKIQCSFPNLIIKTWNYLHLMYGNKKWNQTYKYQITHKMTSKSHILVFSQISPQRNNLPRLDQSDLLSFRILMDIICALIQIVVKL